MEADAMILACIHNIYTVNTPQGDISLKNHGLTRTLILSYTFRGKINFPLPKHIVAFKGTVAHVMTDTGHMT